MANRQRVTATRNTKTNKEAKYWDTSQDVFGVPKDIGETFSTEWRIFSAHIITSIDSNLAQTRHRNPSLQSFFELSFVGSILKPTTVLGSEIDMLLVLNNLPVKRTKTIVENPDTREQQERVEWKTILGIAVTEPVIRHISKDLVNTMDDISNDQQFRRWKYLAKDLPDGRLRFTFQHGQFTINIYPVLKLINGNFGYLCETKSNAVLQEWPDMDHTLSVMNDSYPGFYELIKFCKVLLYKWNSQATESTKIPPVAIDAALLALCSSMLPRIWLESTFYSLFDATLSHLTTAVKQKELKVFSRNLLQGFHDGSVDTFAAWVNEIKSKPKADDDTTLLKFTNSVWDMILKGNISELKDNNNNNNNPETVSSVPVQLAAATSAQQPANNSNDNTQNHSSYMLRAIPDSLDLLHKLRPHLDRVEFTISWKKLALNLGYTTEEITTYDAEPTVHYSPTVSLLQNWQLRPNSTIGVLIEALTKMNNDAAVQVINAHMTKLKHS